MNKTILVIGGYGNFGSFIAKTLAREKDLDVVVAGRSAEKAKSLAATIGARSAVIDIEHDFPARLAAIGPAVVIHTSGPFQKQGYDVARACIAQGCHYIDLADGRDFVSGFAALDGEARAKGILAVCGASSVPGLTSAIIDHYKPEFARLSSVDYGITTAQRTNRGLATTQAILSYCGKPFTTRIGGRERTIHGWQGIHWRKFPDIGYRGLANCDVPDLALFAHRYPDLETIRFYAGLELAFMHIALWLMTWPVRWKLVRSLEPLAPALLKMARFFDSVGSSTSGFYMRLAGKDAHGSEKTIRFELVARDGDGPYIPCIPSILLAKWLARGQVTQKGAMACMGLVSLDDYLEVLKNLRIEVSVTA